MELVDLPVPQPKSNEAVVKIQAAGVNFIDVYNREGRYKAPLPFVLGQEAAGVVSAVGSDARRGGCRRSGGLQPQCLGAMPSTLRCRPTVW